VPQPSSMAVPLLHISPPGVSGSVSRHIVSSRYTVLLLCSEVNAKYSNITGIRGTSNMEVVKKKVCILK